MKKDAKCIWIKSSEELPSINEEVLATYILLLGDYSIFILTYFRENRWIDRECNDCLCPPYWMHIPKEPDITDQERQNLYKIYKNIRR